MSVPSQEVIIHACVFVVSILSLFQRCSYCIVELCHYWSRKCLPFRSTWVRVAEFFVFCVVYCRLLFVVLSFVFWPLYYLSFDLRILIIVLVSSNSSYGMVYIYISVLFFIIYSFIRYINLFPGLKTTSYCRSTRRYINGHSCMFLLSYFHRYCFYYMSVK